MRRRIIIEGRRKIESAPRISVHYIMEMQISTSSVIHKRKNPL